MPVLINWKICDNAQECNGITVCPVGAFSWDKKKQTIKINNKKCINCGVCVESCMVGAIRLARDEKERKKIQKEFDDDPRKVSDLFVDRYGAEPVIPAFLIKKDVFDLEVLQSNKIVAVEVFTADSVMCLLKSIPIRTLFKGRRDIKYRKIEKQDDFFDKYKIKKYPAFLFFVGGKLKGKVEGFYEANKKEALIKKIDELIG
jgi:NAD-dependent dihydropyrimidine dehydrogenase PreA subunit